MYRFGKRSQKRLMGVNLKLKEILNEAIKVMDLTVIEGLRTEERQTTLVKKGSSKTMKSKHLSGKAVDIAPYPINWDDRERFHYMGGVLIGIAKSKGISARWGGDWDRDGEIKDNSFDDLVHIELV